MIILDCTDCYTKVDFKQLIFDKPFSEIDKIILDNSEEIVMFTVDDYMFEFVEYIKEDEVSSCLNSKDCVNRWVVGKYITPIPHLIYMLEEDTWFRITELSANKFTFFMKNELVITMHGMLFYDGEFKENLINRYNINEVRALNDNIFEYIIKKYNESKDDVSIWNAFKCIGVYSEKD